MKRTYHCKGDDSSFETAWKEVQAMRRQELITIYDN